MDKENKSFGKIKMYPVVFQFNLVNGAMGLAELSNNSRGVPTTFEKTIVLVTIVGENMMRLKRKSSEETFIFVCLKMFREGHTHSLGTNSTLGLFSSEKICPPHFCCLSTSS